MSGFATVSGLDGKDCGIKYYVYQFLTNYRAPANNTSDNTNNSNSNTNNNTNNNTIQNNTNNNNTQTFSIRNSFFIALISIIAIIF
jgi:hypothetical protein